MGTGSPSNALSNMTESYFRELIEMAGEPVQDMVLVFESLLRKTQLENIYQQNSIQALGWIFIGESF